jgi:hypothetical protein
MVEEVKKLHLDGYLDMLNIGPQGGEGFSFHVIVFCSITEKKK